MKKNWVFLLALMTGGCALNPPPQLSKPDLAWLSTPVAPSNGDASKVVPDDKEPLTEVERPVRGSRLSVDMPPPRVEDIVLVDPESSASEDEGQLEDAETLDDINALSDGSQGPPQLEGETVASAEGDFDFPVVVNEKVRYYINHFSQVNPESFNRWLERSGRYLPMMEEIFAQEGMPQDLVYLAMIESGFNERAYSVAHAVGPWQFIESTGTLMGLKTDWWRDERRDFEKSTRAAARFLRELKDKFNGDWYLALAAYNAGPNRVLKGLENTSAPDYWVMSREDNLPRETVNYVPKLLAALHIAKNPPKYGFADVAYQKPLQYDTVKLPSATDLEVIARLSGATFEQIRQLNPELKRWCTPPSEKNYSVRLPKGARERFLKAFASLPVSERSNYRLHKVRQGETLKSLAKKYGVRSDDIVAVNRIKDPRKLAVGTDLVLPLKQGLTRVAADSLKDDFVRSRSKTYTLKEGDTLWKVSRKFGVTEKDLMTWNGLSSSSRLQPGQVLIVSGKAAVTARTLSKVNVDKQQGTRKIVYQVQSGDTLWGIGRQFAVDADQILNWNNLNRDSVLQPGDELTLMVQSGRG